MEINGRQINPRACAEFLTVNSHRTSDNRVPNWNHINEEASELCRNLANDLDQDILSPSEASGAFERELQCTLTNYRVTKNRNDQKGHRPRPIEIDTNNEEIPEDQLNDPLEPEVLLTLHPEQLFEHYRA